MKEGNIVPAHDVGLSQNWQGKAWKVGCELSVLGIINGTQKEDAILRIQRDGTDQQWEVYRADLFEVARQKGIHCMSLETETGTFAVPVTPVMPLGNQEQTIDMSGASIRAMLEATEEWSPHNQTVPSLERHLSSVDP